MERKEKRKGGEVRMTRKPELTPKYISQDGRYMGFVSDKKIENNEAKKFDFHDNN